MQISKEFTFEASHILPKHKGKCSRLHGHSWRLWVVVEGPIHEETGFVCDYGELKMLVDSQVINKLDHSHLGCGIAWTGDDQHPWQSYFGPAFYPSSENLCKAVFKLLSPLVQELAKDVHLNKITIAETCTSEATWSKEDELRSQYEPKVK